MEQAGDGLDKVFQAYREACPDPEAGPLFMPKLWEKIEARRSFAWKISRLSRVVAAMAAVVCITIAVLHLSAPAPPSYVFTITYLDALDEASSMETLAFAVNYNGDPLSVYEEPESDEAPPGEVHQ